MLLLVVIKILWLIMWKEEAMPEKFSLLFPDPEATFKALSDITVHDIGMDTIIPMLSPHKNEQTYMLNVMRTVTSDSKTSQYRCEIFDDLLRNRKMREDILALFDRINFLKEYGSYKHDHDHEPGVWDLMHRLDELKDYTESIDAIYKCLESAKIHSEGLVKLREHVHALYTDNGFGELRADIKELRADTQHLKSVTVGINLNERFEACGIGVISLNSKPFTKSNVISRFIDRVSSKDMVQDSTEWNNDYKFNEFSAQNPNVRPESIVTPLYGPLAYMSIRNISEAENQETGITNYMDEITGRMLSHTVKHLRDILGKYTTLTITDMTDLMPELIYYIRWAEYIEKLMNKGYSFCKPDVLISESDDISVNACGIYNMKLVETTMENPSDIVKNDLDFCSDHCLYILTGANRGGKTTITQAIGQAFFMAQGGIYVTGHSFKFSPCDSIFTHFPADEDKTLDLGRLGEECVRFKDIFENATSKSLLLLNETFSTTSFEEGYYIARDCSRAILQKGVRTIYNTHMHKLAQDIDELNRDSETFKAASLIVDSSGGNRSYKVKLAPPEGQSYARDIAQKYGVTYEQLK